eukprot:TRINITY_DN413_c0_g1_i1.p1 TRINITY_DN413_c0_g1~~TRINITY_DN413_c0_g1_i1.p1  ORF type:complete len:830 (-),score=143.23 TRINITY_DN413_c0_g1_i1:275-2764(-)
MEEDASPSPSFLTVGVAVNRSKTSKYAVTWALDKFIPEGRISFKLFHVRPTITTVPTPMGNSLPISKVRDEVASAYKKEVEWQTTTMLLPYKELCTRRQVEAEFVVIEADDVADAISREVDKFKINKLVIGASSHSALARKFKGRSTSSRISGCIPSFCTVYIVSKGKLSSVRASDCCIISKRDLSSMHTSTLETNKTTKDESDCTSPSTNSCISNTSSTRAERSNTDSSAKLSYFHSPLTMQRCHAHSTINQTNVDTRSSANHAPYSRSVSLRFEEDETSSDSSLSELHYGGRKISSYRSFKTDSQSWISDQASTLDTFTDSSSSRSHQVDIRFELERLRIELRHIKGMHAMAENEKIDASQQLHELSTRRMEEAGKLEEMNSRLEKAREIAKQEKEKHEVTKREAEFVRECSKREASLRKEAEIKAAHDATEKEKLEKALMNSDQQYKKFSWEEIVSATSSFSDDFKIGAGGHGMVYKCILHHTIAAVKTLHSIEEHRTKQFQQELEILSRIRHPHVLLLLGACPDHGCLVYEYMENGSLDDRLLRKNNTPPLPWFDRYRITWEVASALVFLHNAKPKPIVHRDLKPANILLDHNLVSKIGDVGLCTLLPGPHSSMSTNYKHTAPVGTFCYIDPEYQRTGMVSPKSDLYAFGIVILQLLTGKSPTGLAHIVETALEEGHLVDILDTEAGKWPIEETQELAVLGLSCTELRGIDRPDLKAEVLPILERLKENAYITRDSSFSVQPVPPNHFICPILQDVMGNPHVAADGYSYERRAIEIWLSMNDKSPMTNLPFPNKNLIPNYTLLSAIMEWKSRKQGHSHHRPFIVQ